jgi:hypothetical protein
MKNLAEKRDFIIFASSMFSLIKGFNYEIILRKKTWKSKQRRG